MKREMRRHGLDAYIVIQNLRYFTGSTASKALIVPLDGKPTLLCSRLEQDQAKKGWIRDVRAYSSWEGPLRPGEKVHFKDPWQLLADRVKESEARAVGFDRAGRSLVRKLRGIHPASYLELPELVQEIRKVKSKEEISLLRKSAEIASKGMRAAAETIGIGRTELEVAAEIEYAMRMTGSEGVSFPTIVASGKNSWLPHAQATKKKLRNGELVVVDLGAFYDGYASDMTRTFALKPIPKQLKILELVKRAQAAGVSRVKEGASAGEVDSAARNVLREAGYSKYCPHGTGHGVGTEIHEFPSLWPKSKDVLKAGMVITVEPGVYLPRVGGVRWEDMVLVKKKGNEILTKLK